MRCRALILAFGLMLSSLALNAAWAADPPHINKPRPAPANMPPDVPPLPPAQFDNKLAIGGEDVKAKKVSTRLSVDVLRTVAVPATSSTAAPTLLWSA
jgi:hypothetical protein